MASHVRIEQQRRRQIRAVLDLSLIALLNGHNVFCRQRERFSTRELGGLGGICLWI